ncbi:MULTISPECIES: ABC transporter ATP-binding protein [Lysinibacillus]|uniref:ABC transporter ATP-binding protein n=1 Tax=Lysinibacillus TaxID=400634 RepID=UPI0030F59FC9
MNSLVRVSNLSFSYKGLEIFKDLNIDYSNESIVGLVGENGVGKSTLMKLLLGHLSPSKGSISFNNEIINPIKNKEYIFNIGALIEEPKFYKNMTGIDNLRYLSMLNKNMDFDWIKYLSEALHLELNKKIKNYSLGMKQKLGIILALSKHPKLVILDEPFNGLDWKSVARLKEIINETQVNYGTAFIISSHLLEEINSLCNTVHLIKDKKVFHLEKKNFQNYYDICFRSLDDAHSFGKYILDNPNLHIKKTRNAKIFKLISVSEEKNNLGSLYGFFSNNSIYPEEIKKRSVTIKEIMGELDG